MYSNNYFPQLVLLEITNACNLRCLHCGSSSGKCRTNEMTTQEIYNLIDELVGLKADTFNVIGGEALMRKDWADICAHIRSRGARVCLGSNGTLITPETLRKAIAADVNGIGFSIDGVPATHDYVRQYPGAFNKTMASFKLVKELTEIVPSVITSLSRMNAHDIESIHGHLCDLGELKWRLQLVNPVGRMDTSRDQMLTDDEFEAVADRILKLKQSSPLDISLGNNIGYYGTKAMALHNGMPFLGDYLGLRVVGITADGSVKGDLSLPDEFIEGNIRERSFTSIWTSDDSFAYNRKFNMDMVGGFCRQCKYLPLCKGGDAASSFAASGVRADAPYCLYRIEHARGEEPQDSTLITSLLERCHQSMSDQSAV